jgi:hypothetical protein
MNMRAAAARDQLIAVALVTLAIGYLWLFVPRNWIPHDEGMLGQSAERVLNGDIPHVDYEEPYTGGLTWLHAAVFKLAGIDLLYPRWLLFAGAVLAQLLTYALIRRFLEPIAAVTATLVALVWSFPNYFAALPSWWLLICALACIWAFVRYVETGRPLYAVWSGAAAGCAILIKQTGLYVLMALVMAFVYGYVAQRDTRLNTRAARFLATAVAISGMAVALGILRSRLSLSDLLYLFLPIAACCRLLISASAHDEPAHPQELRNGLIPALAGAAVPIACFVAPYIAGAHLGTFLHGAFALPQRRVQFASFELPPPHWIVAGIPLLLVVSPLPRFGWWQELTWRRSVAAIGTVAAVALAYAALSDQMTYQLIWQSARAMSALLPVAICTVIESGHVRDLKRHWTLFAAAVMLAWASLVQFPFSAPIYFCYIAPLAVIGAVALADSSNASRRPALPVAAALLLAFAVASMNRGYVYNLGGVHRVTEPVVPLDLERVSLRVSEPDAVMYRRVMSLVATHIGDGTLVAGPDCPEVYFLAGRFSPSGTLFDFFDDHASLEGGVDDLPGWRSARVVVLNHSRRFSFGPSTHFAAKVRKAFPKSEGVGTFEVRWQ